MLPDGELHNWGVVYEARQTVSHGFDNGSSLHLDERCEYEHVASLENLAYLIGGHGEKPVVIKPEPFSSTNPQLGRLAIGFTEE